MARTRKTDKVYKVAQLPFPVASVVRFENDEDEEKLLVSELVFRDSRYPEYALLGHSKLGSRGTGYAWIDHSSLVLVEPASVKSWGILLGARENPELM